MKVMNPILSEGTGPENANKTKPTAPEIFPKKIAKSFLIYFLYFFLLFLLIIFPFIKPFIQSQAIKYIDAGITVITILVSCVIVKKEWRHYLLKK